MNSQRWERAVNRPRSSTRTLRLVLLILASVFVLMSAGVAVLLYLATLAPSDVKPEKFYSDTERNGIAKAFEQRMDAVTRQQASPKPGAAPVVINQRELNAYIQSSPDIQTGLKEFRASDLVINIKEKQIIASVKMPLHGVTVPVTAAISVETGPDGSSIFAVRSIRAGRVPLNASMVDRIDEMLLNPMRTKSAGLPEGMLGIEAEDGRLIITPGKH